MRRSQLYARNIGLCDAVHVDQTQCMASDAAVYTRAGRAANRHGRRCRRAAGPRSRSNRWTQLVNSGHRRSLQHGCMPRVHACRVELYDSIECANVSALWLRGSPVLRSFNLPSLLTQSLQPSCTRNHAPRVPHLPPAWPPRSGRDSTVTPRFQPSRRCSFNS